MLNSIDLNDKSYEDLLAEAVAQIPLYSGEWTNFNRSDPGITILQNLSAFHLLQQSTINQVTDQVRRRLLKLVGYEARENRGAVLLLQADVEEETCLPAQYKLWAGDICFETEGPVTLRPWRLDSVCTVEDGVWQDVTYLLDPSVPSAAQPFGAHPAPGRALCLLLEGKPDRSLTLWAQTPRDQVRAPFGDSGFSFAKTRWQYYTADGWADARAEDETRGFLASGAVRLELAGGEPALCPEGPGGRYALRCLLEEADYDLPPRLHTLAANLFSVVQRETRSAGYLFNGGVRVEVKSELAALGNLFVYCREVKGGPYRLYRQDPETGARGRFYRRSDHPDGVTLTFDRKAFGFAPGQGWGAVRVVCYDDELVHHRDLGPVYGYEDQVIDLDLVENVLPDGVSLIAEAPGADGELEYHFVNPGNTDPDTLCYQVESRPGRLRIVHPGLGTEYRLYLCDCAVTRGAAGNIREGGALEHRPRDPWAPKGPVFQNPAPGRGGVTFESAEDLRLRFLADVRTPATAVLASDYEDLVRRTPGLCIHKVKAVVREEENLVQIAVKPWADAPLPQLSDQYRAQIMAWLEPRRMLTTRIELLPPKYVPIDVAATLRVKSYFDHAQEEIEAALRQALDHVDGPAGFGGWVRFNELYQALSALPCVDEVESLRLLPADRAAVTAEGADLRLDDQSLCCPGQFQLELRTYGGAR